MTISQPALQNSFGKLFVIIAALARKTILTARQVRSGTERTRKKTMTSCAFPARESLERFGSVGISAGLYSACTRAGARAPAVCRASASMQKPNVLSTPFEQRLEIGAGALRLVPRGFRGVAEAEITVDQASAMMVLRHDACGSKRVGIGLALIAQGIEPRRANHRRRKSREIFGAQRRDAPIRAVRRIGEIVTGEPFHHRARQEVALRVFRA